ncbi:hypothetical protein [Streptomyces sp. ODS05-4]|uniref:hypothetical protein n=1 Tax=Streptomyces sp. ODS05-4 TaxID=2944939 RepID=UPI0021099B63|nr:hypothetical protein [Streptomyces sp. ODS05-4]
MSNRYGAAARGTVWSAAAASLVLVLVACGQGDGSDKAPRQSAAATTSGPAEQPPSAQESQEPEPSQTLATISGANGFEVLIHSAKRDEGGFLTVTGTLKNTTSKTLIAPTNWSGVEVDVKRTGPSLAGATLVDKTEKKRYYVLRDTEGYPLTTTGISVVKARESLSIFAQFPAPPANVASVDLQIPLMPPATIELS